MIDAPDIDPSGSVEQLRPLLTRWSTRCTGIPAAPSWRRPAYCSATAAGCWPSRRWQLLRSNGFSVRRSADLSRAALQTAIMLVSGRPGAETTVPQDERAAVMAGKRAALAALPADRFPYLVECADAMTDCEDEIAYYAAGIDLFIAGVQALQRRLPRLSAAAAG